MEPGPQLGRMLEVHSRNPAGTREHAQKPSSKRSMLKEGEEGKKSWEMAQERGNGEAASDRTSLDLVGYG